MLCQQIGSGLDLNTNSYYLHLSTTVNKMDSKTKRTSDEDAREQNRLDGCVFLQILNINISEEWTFWPVENVAG
jgi:hypothetical protein